MVLVGVLFFYSCTDDKEVYPETRLFRPVLNKPLLAQNNTITVDMAKLTKAVAYKVEISRDEFATVLGVLETPANKIVITDLLWNTKYQVRVTALAASAEFNSKISDLGSVTTDKFPSILQAPTQEDIVDYSARMRWAIGALSGAPITQVKVFAIEDEALKNPLFTVAVSSSEQLSGVKIVNGLSAGTQYQLAIYSGDVVRGWEKYTTKDALATGPNVVDLRGIVATATTFYDAVASAPAGGTVILDPLQTYTVSANCYLDKSITIKSGYTLVNTTGAIINSAATSFQLELAANANIASIVVDGVSFIGDTGRTKYVFNAGTAVTANVTELKFVNCKMTNYRDLIRTRPQWTSGSFNQITIDNCIMTNFGNAGLLIVDAAANNTMPNIVFKNSTFSKVEKLINNRATTNTNSLVISDCTFCESPKAGQLIEYLKTTNILQGILITNTIFGRGGDNGGNYDNPFIKSGDLPATTITSSNTFKTNDFKWTSPVAPATTPVPNFSTYGGATGDLWIDPLNGNFNFKDLTFQGTKTCGDPRWRK